MWKTIKKILGILTDVLTFGREQGWWSRGSIDTPEEYEEACRYFEDNVHKLPDYEQAKLFNMLNEYEKEHELF